MEAAIKDLFDRYEKAMARALAGRPDMDALMALYASDVIAASSAGLRSGKTDDQFRQALVDGHARYRGLGTREMRIRALRIVPIDSCHFLVPVHWTATYERKDVPRTVLDFTVHYLVQVRDGQAKVFGWIAGDEDAVLKQHGIL